MPLKTDLQIKLAMTEHVVTDFGSPQSIVNYEKVISLLTGTATLQADVRWSDQRTLTSSQNENLDLAASLVGAFGNTLTFYRLKGFLVYSVTGTVIVTRPTSNGVPIFSLANDGVTFGTGGCFLYCSPVNGTATPIVVPGTADIINIATGASGCTYDIHIWGTSGP